MLTPAVEGLLLLSIVLAVALFETNEGFFDAVGVLGTKTLFASGRSLILLMASWPLLLVPGGTSRPFGFEWVESTLFCRRRFFLEDFGGDEDDKDDNERSPSFRFRCLWRLDRLDRCNL